MSAVFQEITIGWDGKSYNIKPTMAILNEIEQHVSISQVAYHLVKKAPRVSHIALIISIFLRHAGVSVSDEEVYAELIKGEKASLVEVGNMIILAAYPQLGKPEAQTTSDTKRKRKADSKK